MPQNAVRESVASALRRRGVLAAFAAAAAVFAVLLVQGFLLSALTSSATFAQLGLGFGPSAASIWIELLRDSLADTLPFAIGVAVSFWQFAPIGPELRVAHVVTRSLLACLIGALVVVFVVVILAFVTALAGLPSVFFGGGTAPFSHFGSDVLTGVLGAARSLVQDAPLVVLAGLLLWGWLQRHPHDTPISGAIDEV